MTDQYLQLEYSVKHLYRWLQQQSQERGQLLRESLDLSGPW
jgi:hypothetical protein